MLQLDFSTFPVLQTDHLILRQLNSDDLEAIYFLRSDENILRLIGKTPVKTIKEAKDFLTMINESIKASVTILWGIVQNENPENVIGTICLWRINKQNYRAEIGYVLNPAYWRKGIMKESILKIIEYGFYKMKLHTIEARIRADNSPSASILEATGFVKEGYLKDEYFFQGKFYDTVIYSKHRG